jgi:hypothetical protein
VRLPTRRSLAPHAAVVALAALIESPGCHGEAPRAPPPPPLDGVEIARCASVIRGRICLLGGDRKLNVFVPGGTTEAVVSTDALDLAQAATTGVDGHRFEVAIPTGATRLVVTARTAGEVRRFSARLGDAPVEPGWLEDARKKKERGALDDATRALDESERGEHGEEDGGAHSAEVASLRARIALARGDGDRASALLAASAELHAARGELSKAADDLGARAYVLITDLRRAAEARVTIARLAAFADDYPEAGALAPYYAGLLDGENGDLGTSLSLLADARAKAERIGVDKITRAVIQVSASTLNAVGRVSEAYAFLARLEREQGASMSPCERGTLALNVGSTALSAQEAPVPSDGAPPDPLPSLRTSVEAFSGVCPDPRRRALALNNLAWGELQAGSIPRAREALAEARRILPHPRPLLAFAELETEGRTALADGDPRAALRAYDELAAGAAGVSRIEEEAAEEGRAGALKRLGDRAAALEAASRAELLLDEAARAIPAGEGRGAFWWTRARVAQMRVELLLDAGRTAAALDAARIARARIVGDVQHAARVESLAPAPRARWDDALAQYRAARDAIVAEVSDDWSFVGEALARRIAQRRARDVAARALLDEAARALFPTPRRTVAPLADEDGVVGLALVPLDGAWAAFTVENGTTHVVRVAAPTEPSHAAQSAPLLFQAVAPNIARARRLRLLPFGALREVDLSALDVAGEPLVARVTVEYPLDAGDPPPDGEAGGAHLIVADPTGQLPAARQEGRAIAATLGDAGARLLVGGEATRARVMSELGLASSLHFAGHGSYAGTDGWESALTLAAGERMSVADILALSHAPARVILSGCETGNEQEIGGGPTGLSLADAFIAAGSRVVIASTRRVDDEMTSRLMQTLASALVDSSADLPEALRRAQLEVRSALPSSDWSAFRAFVR